MTHEDIERIVVDEIAEVLMVEPDEVVADARFFEDLGGESIDHIDLSFRITKAVGRDVRLVEMVKPDEVEFDEENRLTASSLARLRERHPHLVREGDWADGSRPTASDLFTVGAIVRHVQHIVREAVATGP